MESPLKIMKNAFYFILKILFFLKCDMTFCHDFLVMYEKALIRKIRLTSKFMMSKPS